MTVVEEAFEVSVELKYVGCRSIFTFSFLVIYFLFFYFGIFEKIFFCAEFIVARDMMKTMKQT